MNHKKRTAYHRAKTAQWYPVYDDAYRSQSARKLRWFRQKQEYRPECIGDNPSIMFWFHRNMDTRQKRRMKRLYGTRCEDFNPHCVCCVSWTYLYTFGAVPKFHTVMRLILL
jgi:hypothetical protein